MQTGALTLPQLLDKMSYTPARLLRIPAGSLRAGMPADIVLFDPDTSWTVDPERLHGKSKNTPFKGMTLKGKVKTTILAGRVVYQDMDCR